MEAVFTPEFTQFCIVVFGLLFVLIVLPMLLIVFSI